VVELIPSSLVGKRVLITRAALQSEDLANALKKRGAVPIMKPLIAFSDPDDFSPLDTAISRMEQFDWLMFTSGEGVRAVAKRSSKLGQNLAQYCSDLSVAAVGPATAEELRKSGLHVDYVAKVHSGIGLANELGVRLRDKKVLLPRSDRANPDLPKVLKQYGAEVIEVIAYKTLPTAETELTELTEFVNGKAEAVLFFSPSAVLHFTEVFGAEQLSTIENKLAITAVGPVTASALRQAGAHRIVIAADTTADAVVAALEEHFASAAKQAPAGANRV
jgi:uroporphyrinogen III methyltransferase/synthase